MFRLPKLLDFRNDYGISFVRLNYSLKKSLHPSILTFLPMNISICFCRRGQYDTGLEQAVVSLSSLCWSPGRWGTTAGANRQKPVTLPRLRSVYSSPCISTPIQYCLMFFLANCSDDGILECCGQGQYAWRKTWCKTVNVSTWQRIKRSKWFRKLNSSRGDTDCTPTKKNYFWSIDHPLSLQ